MAAAKNQTKKDLEVKIAELEAKLNQLSAQLETKPAGGKACCNSQAKGHFAKRHGRKTS